MQLIDGNTPVDALSIDEPIGQLLAGRRCRHVMNNPLPAGLVVLSRSS